MSKLMKLADSYEWVHEIANKTIIELKKTSDMIEEVHNSFFSQYGISNTKFNVLAILYNGPKEGMMLSDIGEQMLVTKGNITGLIDRLEKHGFVRRVRDDVDRRKVMAVITEKGMQFTKELMENYKQWTKDVMMGLDTEEKNELIRILKKMQQNFIQLRA